MKRVLLIVAAFCALGCGSAPPPEPAPVPEPPPLLPDGTPVGEDAIEPPPEPENPRPEPSAASEATPEPGAESPQPEPAAEAPSAVPEANLTVGSMTVDEMTVNDLECRLEGVGFMTTLQLLGSIAAQKKALDRCAPKGDAPLVRWTFAGGKAKDVVVEGAADGKVKKCVAKAAAKMESEMVGDCAAYFLVGAAAGAQAAYERAKGGN